MNVNTSPAVILGRASCDRHDKYARAEERMNQPGHAFNSCDPHHCGSSRPG